jgi:hypothetical protein
MKLKLVLPAIASFVAAFALGPHASAQTYTIDWYKIAGGGGTSSSGAYQITGTIGQPDAGGTMSGGGYALTGGFWSLVSVVQTPGAPILTIVPVGPGSVRILWPANGSFILQQNGSLAAGAWTANTNDIARLDGTNSITIAPLTGNLFFRLANP